LDETPVTEFSISNKQMKATFVIQNGAVALKKLTAKATKITIPNTVKAPNGKKYKVTEILAEALKGNKNLKTVIIPKNVKVLKKNLFKGCKKLKTIGIIGTIKTVKKGAFAGIKNVMIRINDVTKKEFNRIKTTIEKSGIGKTVKIVKGK
ncbi:MAG: leucine-rich repeat domain-containing protein, partial [Lachnospiraceae bacterium]|nr:leucine-rich repeat domain-containing protein [Lachnospiraceae bacterium]